MQRRALSSPLRLLVALLLLAAAAPALAEVTAGRWALRAGDATLMLFEVAHSDGGWTASWTQPADYRIDGVVIHDANDTPVRRIARAVRVTDDAVELVFDNPLAGGAPDRFTIRPHDAGQARLIWAAYAATPFLLNRVTAAARLGPWRSGRRYALATDMASDAEMTAIYDADQAARANAARVDWSVVGPADARRRARTQALLVAGRLASADDFYHAAFVFQHGDTPDDYLKAHALAVIAIDRGRRDASWIAAATLDRFLQSIERPQIYGTQFRPGAAFTQEPYDRTLLPDALRQANGVPPLAEQEEQRREWDRRIPRAADAPP